MLRSPRISVCPGSDAIGPGDTVIIPPGVVHWGRAGPKGLRSISSWVKDDSKPMRESVAP